ncbi:MAG: hypothetical protein ACHQWU_07525 [Gemmatimonadales bacterium]
MRAAALLILVVAATHSSAQLGTASPSSYDRGTHVSGAPLLNRFALEIGVGSAPMRSAEGTPTLDLAAAQRWRIHFAPSASPAHSALFRLVERASGIGGEIGYSNSHAWSGWQYALRAARTHPIGTSGMAVGAWMAVGGVDASVDAERSVTSGDGQVTSRGVRYPSDSVYTFGSRSWSGEAGSVVRWSPVTDGYLFLEVGYRVTRDLGDWRVRMGDVPLELRSATWETAPPMLRTRGPVVRVGFGALAPAK